MPELAKCMCLFMFGSTCRLPAFCVSTRSLQTYVQEMRHGSRQLYGRSIIPYHTERDSTELWNKLHVATSTIISFIEGFAFARRTWTGRGCCLAIALVRKDEPHQPGLQCWRSDHDACTWQQSKQNLPFARLCQLLLQVCHLPFEGLVVYLLCFPDIVRSIPPMAWRLSSRTAWLFRTRSCNATRVRYVLCMVMSWPWLTRKMPRL